MRYTIRIINKCDVCGIKLRISSSSAYGRIDAEKVANKKARKQIEKHNNTEGHFYNVLLREYINN